MGTFLIVLITITCVLLVLAVLVQNPKSGMASNFGERPLPDSMRQS